jgi:hypothetical protein
MKILKIKQLHGKMPDDIISHIWPISCPETKKKATILAGNLCFLKCVHFNVLTLWPIVKDFGVRFMPLA